jgi:hypothetical protein
MAQLAVLPFQRLGPLPLVSGRARPPALVALGLPNPVRQVCAVQPILAAIGAIAAHCDLCSARCSNTIRDARSRTSTRTSGTSCDST